MRLEPFDAWWGNGRDVFICAREEASKAPIKASGDVKWIIGLSVKRT